MKDLVTGKRFWAHGPDRRRRAECAGGVVLVQDRPHGSGNVDFVPYLVDNDSGIGTQVTIGKVDKDEFPEIIVGNKKGVFVMHHTAKKANEEEYQQAQPKPLNAK